MFQLSISLKESHMTVSVSKNKKSPSTCLRRVVFRNLDRSFNPTVLSKSTEMKLST